MGKNQNQETTRLERRIKILLLLTAIANLITALLTFIKRLLGA